MFNFVKIPDFLCVLTNYSLKVENTLVCLLKIAAPLFFAFAMSLSNMLAGGPQFLPIMLLGLLLLIVIAAVAGSFRF